MSERVFDCISQGPHIRRDGCCVALGGERLLVWGGRDEVSYCPPACHLLQLHAAPQQADSQLLDRRTSAGSSTRSVPSLPSATPQLQSPFSSINTDYSSVSRLEGGGGGAGAGFEMGYTHADICTLSHSRGGMARLDSGLFVAIVVGE